MGFRFFNLNSINKSHSYLHSISSNPHKNSIFTLQNSSKILPLTTLLQFHIIHHPQNLKRFHFDHFHHENRSQNPRKVHKDSIFALQSASTIQNPPNLRTFKRGHFGHSHHDHGFSEKSMKNENVFRLGLAADVGLTVGKAITGYLSGSTAIIADAAHSLSDVVLSGVALVSYKAARVPRDKEHPYGHGKFETLGALGISGMLLVTAGGIAWHAVDILLALLAAAPEVVIQSSVDHHEHHHGGHSHQIDMSHPFLALNMAVLSIGVKECLFWITKKAGDKEGSGLMKANAWHHRADAISSFIALIGVGGTILGVRYLDPLAGLLVSGMILKAGLESGHQSILELVDAAVPQQLLDAHRKTILKVDGVKGCHRLRGRRAGSFLHLDVHIEVDSFASVSAAHHIGENVRRQIHKCHPEVAEVFIHIDPLIPQISRDVPECEDVADKTNTNISLEQNAINTIISGIFSSQFSERMTVEHIRPHLLQNKILLDVEVSMPSDIMIRDAMLMAEEAKKEILRNISNAVQVNIQLRLSQPNHHTTS